MCIRAAHSSVVWIHDLASTRIGHWTALKGLLLERGNQYVALDHEDGVLRTGVQVLVALAVGLGHVDRVVPSARCAALDHEDGVVPADVRFLVALAVDLEHDDRVVPSARPIWAELALPPALLPRPRRCQPASSSSLTPKDS